MKRTFFISTLVFTSTIFAFFFEIKAQQDDDCLIAKLTNKSISLAYPESNWNVPISIKHYLLSPSHSHVAMQLDPMSPETKIGIYLVTRTGLQEQMNLENTQFIRGFAWSDDGNKLLLQDSKSDHLINVYNLETGELIPLTDNLLPPLQIHQVAWIPDNQGILFVATERLFPTTEFGSSGVSALYYIDLDTFEVTPISQPDENVDWYFDNFVGSSSNQIVYSSCSIDDEACNINIIRPDETISIIGDYNILEVISQNEILVYRSNQVGSEDSFEFEILILDAVDGALTPLQTIPAVSDFPVPIMSVSPDKSKLSYMIDETGLAILDIRQGVSRTIAFLDSPSPGKWHPNSNELLYWTDKGLFLYTYDIDDNRVLSTVQDALLAEFMWLCVQDG